jgi:ATP-dependent Lon protease
VIERLSPIQIASANLDEYLQGRAAFTRDEWVDVLLRSMGYEPTHADFTFRRKLLFLLRLVPMVERNYNLIELGPRGTGKSYVYRELSPYVILLSGGQGGVPDLFGWKTQRRTPRRSPRLPHCWEVWSTDSARSLRAAHRCQRCCEGFGPHGSGSAAMGNVMPCAALLRLN